MEGQVKTLIYMSEELKKPKMDVSRATIVQSGPTIKYGGQLRIVDKQGNTLASVLIDPKGLKAAPDHFVKAWIETEYEVVQL